MLKARAIEAVLSEGWERWGKLWGMAMDHAPKSEADLVGQYLHEAVMEGHLRIHPDDLNKPWQKQRFLKGPVPYDPSEEPSDS